MFNMRSNFAFFCADIFGFLLSKYWKMKFHGLFLGLIVFSCHISLLHANNLFDIIPNDPNLTLKQIKLEKYPNAFNPSIIKTEQGILLSFRYCPEGKMWVSYVGLALLDHNFELITEPQLLSINESSTCYCAAHHEDARLFSYNGEVFIVYGDYRYSSTEDCTTIDYHSIREDVAIAKINFENGQFSVENQLTLIKHPRQEREKNWVPFQWNGKLLFSYYPLPHEIIEPNLKSGNCKPFSKINAETHWLWGPLRGGTPAVLVDGEYLAFFHSWVSMKSSISKDHSLPHYFMGAYTFSSHPPFEITKISCIPLKAPGMYTNSTYHVRSVFPGGFVVLNDDVYIAFGKDDNEIWIAKISKEELKQSLVSVSSD